MSIVSVVQRIPPEIWGVLLGSTLAFGGTFLATRLQLRHDATQRERERQMQLRRDVFMEAAEGVSGTTEYFMQFANLDVALGQISPAISRPGWLNKLYGVASLETIEAFTVANAALGAAAFDLLQLRLPGDNLKLRIDNLNQQIASLRAAQDQMRTAAAATEHEPQTPELLKRLETLQERWTYTWSELERLTTAFEGAVDARLRAQRTLLESAVGHAISYQKRLRAAMVALRKELDFPIDATAFEDMMEKVDAEMLPKFQALLDTLDADAREPV